MFPLRPFGPKLGNISRFFYAASCLTKTFIFARIILWITNQTKHNFRMEIRPRRSARSGPIQVSLNCVYHTQSATYFSYKLQQLRTDRMIFFQFDLKGLIHDAFGSSDNHRAFLRLFLCDR